MVWISGWFFPVQIFAEKNAASAENKENVEFFFLIGFSIIIPQSSSLLHLQAHSIGNVICVMYDVGQGMSGVILLTIKFQAKSSGFLSCFSQARQWFQS